jgi:hypothetical protein
MTEDEKRQQKAMLLLEYQEAEQNLAHLQEKAHLISRSLSSVSQWLAKSHDRTWNFNPSEPIYTTGETVKILEDPRFAVAMDFPAMKALALEIKASMDNLRSLRQRKEALGLK